MIKVLRPELAAGINAERFDREIKLAASLQQANIAPLLAAGHAAGFACYTMLFVEGRSLRDWLAREGRLPIGDAVNVLRDVARALAFAHSQGVVHQDIKPGNVLLSGGTVVVTDFGTLPYMAPEQDRGRPLPLITVPTSTRSAAWRTRCSRAGRRFTATRHHRRTLSRRTAPSH